MWLVGTPSVLGGAAIGLTLIQFHWFLFLPAFLVADLAFQFTYSRVYRAAFVRNGSPPPREFYLKAVLVQLPIVAGVLGTYYAVLTTQ